MNSFQCQNPKFISIYEVKGIKRKLRNGYFSPLVENLIIRNAKLTRANINLNQIEETRSKICKELTTTDVFNQEPSTARKLLSTLGLGARFGIILMSAYQVFDYSRMVVHESINGFSPNKGFVIVLCAAGFGVYMVAKSAIKQSIQQRKEHLLRTAVQIEDLIKSHMPAQQSSN